MLRLAADKDGVIPRTLEVAGQVAPRAGIAPGTCEGRLAHDLMPYTTDHPRAHQWASGHAKDGLWSQGIDARLLLSVKDPGPNPVGAQIVARQLLVERAFVDLAGGEVHKQQLTSIAQECHGRPPAHYSCNVTSPQMAAVGKGSPRLLRGALWRAAPRAG